MTKEKPILFNADMVRAILDGRKTQTRRAVKHKNPIVRVASPDKSGPFKDVWLFDYEISTSDGVVIEHTYAECPMGKIGDKLWVRESWAAQLAFDNIKPIEIGHSGLYYPSDNSGQANGRIRPSIHMPRWASRIQLEITDIRVERLNDISEGDALSEGICPREIAARGYTDAKTGFSALWNSIYKNWDENPYVWVIEFKVVK